ncbi:ABC transporter ATP-binding protein [Microbacterium excoecariae]|uniref:ABC transporter ATP-binding protein n=1 Tax=Microbacterium excoecariae TaxID=2715210 RepID=UPI0030B8B4F8|nr:ABC transporter ATP-binding protein [Microbacterium excoecariae]
MTAPVLEVDGLTIRAGDRVLVDDLSFSVRPGERIGLIGESGSGKSLTTLAILGLLPEPLTASGRIRLGGVDALASPERDLVRVRGRVAAPVFQEPATALDPLMRVGRQVALPLARHRRLRGAALRDETTRLFADVALTDPRIRRAFPHELSGGQRQRVALAIALAADPRVLLADEPTTALDVSVQAEVLALIDRLARSRGMAVVFVSHDLAVVSQIADHGLVLRAGTVVEEGPVDVLLRRPRAAYTADLVAAARRFENAARPGRTA